MARYDAVIIGAGLGGLAAGAILAREGRKILLIERGNSRWRRSVQLQGWRAVC